MIVKKVWESVSHSSKEQNLKRDDFLTPALFDIKGTENHSQKHSNMKLSGPFNVTPEVTRIIAKTAKLSLTDKEVEQFTDDLKEILSAFAVLDSINVDNVKPSFLPIPLRNVLRDDSVKKSIGQEEALKFTGQKEDGFFIGPRTVD